MVVNGRPSHVCARNRAYNCESVPDAEKIISTPLSERPSCCFNSPRIASMRESKASSVPIVMADCSSESRARPALSYARAEIDVAVLDEKPAGADDGSGRQPYSLQLVSGLIARRASPPEIRRCSIG